MVEVICINDKNRPSEIPYEKWIKKDSNYHIWWIDKIMLMGGQLGCKLEEIWLDDSCNPYEYFMLSRFAILNTKENLEALAELLKESKDASEVDIDELLKIEEFELIENNI